MHSRSAALLSFFCSLLAAINTAAALEITTLSTRPEMVSGGDVLVRISDPANLPFKVTLNSVEVTNLFQASSERGTWIGLVNGLQLGANTLRATRMSANGKHTLGGNGTNDQSLTIINHPVQGPVFSGPYEQPFYCFTQNFPLPGNPTGRLGPPLDANCSVATRVDYVYRATNNTFKTLPAGPGYPSDMVTTTTTQGKTVPYIVRVETGTINRGIYQTSVLHDPRTEPAPSPFTPPASWNRRLVYTFGGGCVGGWYIQGSSIGNAQGILEDLQLRQGYALASNTLNVFGNNCNDVLAAETTMMVRERFIETYGPVAFTIGYGCSAGAEEAHTIVDNFPGLLDGIVVGCSFIEPTGSLTFSNIDADLMWNYFQKGTTPWSEAQMIAASGFVNTFSISELGARIGQMHKSHGPRVGQCNAIVPPATIFDPITNPNGVRCDFYSHMVNVFGRDPRTGYGRRTLDNVGVQYGLAALNAGQITKAQFIDLNRNIGGFDNNGDYSTSRAVGDLTAIRIAYQTGRIITGGQGMRMTPIIDYRAYMDLIQNNLVTHQRAQGFMMRTRLDKANGHHDNQVMLTEDNWAGNFGDQSPVVQFALGKMDEWLTNLLADRSNAAARVKLNRAKPADLVDACYTNQGTVRIVEEQVYTGATTCNALYGSHSAPRMVAGMPLANDVLKCSLKPLDPRDYTGVVFNTAEWDQLAAIFPTGVCDWTVPGAEQQLPLGTWITFGP